MPSRPSVFLKVTHSKGRQYAYLAHSVRRGTRVETELLYRFGVVTDQQVQNARAWISTDPLLPSSPRDLLADFDRLSLSGAWEYGSEALGHFLWGKLGLHRITLEALGGIPHKGHQGHLIEIMVLNRLADPMSKWGLLTEWLEDSAAPFLVGLPLHTLNDNQFYRAMDRLWSRQDALERKVWEEVVRPLTPHPEFFLHDNTSTWFEGEQAELGAYSGHAPDGRTDRPRVKWGVVATEEGFPVTLAVFPGNTKDDQTPRAMRNRLGRVLGIQGGVYIGDRGMKSDLELRDLEKAGFRWILAARNREVEEVLIRAREEKIVAVSERNEVREVVTDKGRFIVLMNEARRQEELMTLDRRLVEGRAIIAEWRGKAGKTDHHEILKGVQAELGEAHLLDLFEIDFDEVSSQGLLSGLKKKVEFRKQWAGWWVLRTNTEMPVEEVARQYLQLARVEEGHRVLKETLDVRPLRHRLERRVGAHLLLCQLALVIVKYVDQRVKEAELKDREGEPLTGPSAIASLRKVKAGEVELPGTGQRRIVVTKLKPAQEAILRAVGVDPERFHRGWERLL